VLVAVVVLGEHLGRERILGGVLVVLAAMLAQVGRGKS
jgi:drug/metabolite transporter (DMT)-like permease